MLSIDESIMVLCGVGILYWLIEYLTAEDYKEYLTWEELMEQIKKERKEDEDED